MEEIVQCEKTFHLQCSRDFDFGCFGQRFDYALAHSVFTHLSFDEIETCLVRLKDVMRPGGQLFFTVVTGGDQELQVVYAEGTPMTLSHHADLSVYDDIAARLGIEIAMLEDGDHPTQVTCRAVF